MTDLISSIIYGITGGLARLVVDLIKTYMSKKKPNFTRLGFYIILLIAFGAFSGIIFGFAGQLSFLGGYAGLDLIDGYYKHFRRKKFKIRLDFAIS